MTSGGTSKEGRDGPSEVKIESVFYTENFDAINEFWKSMPEDPSEEYLKMTIKRREQELNIISGQLSRKVMDHYDAFVEAMQNIQKLSEELRLSKEICREGRDGVHTAKDHLSMGGLRVITLYERREQYLVIAKHLQNIKKIVHIRKSLREKIREKNYSEAINLCSTCSKLIQEYTKFNCVKGMDIKAEYDTVIEKLDEALGIACRYPFDSVSYANTIHAFEMIGKPSHTIKRINRHFSNHITVVAMNTLRSHVLMNPVNSTQVETIQNLKLRSLVKKLSEDQFVSCFRLMMSQMVDIMFAHHFMKKWLSDFSDKDANLAFYSEVGTGIEQYRKTMWGEMQDTLSSMCLQGKLASFQIESFLTVLDDLNTFVEIGEDFGGESAHKLRGSIKQLSKGYYEDFHQKRMDELRGMLENELWLRYDNLHSKFSVKDIDEINMFLSERIFMSNNSVNSSVQEGAQKASVLARLLKTGNPFLPQKTNIDPTTSSTATSTTSPRRLLSAAMVGGGNDTKDIYDENNKELWLDSVDEFGGRKAHSKESLSPRKDDQDTTSGPMLALTVINLVRMIGKYGGMMKTLANVSWDICQGMMQVVQFYTHAVLTFFGPSLNIAGLRISPTMKINLQQLQTKFSGKLLDPKSTGKQTASLKPNDRVNVSSSTMYGLLPRHVAAESFLFLQNALEAVRQQLQKLLPKANIAILNQFYILNVDTLGEVRLLLYKELCHKLIPADNMVNKVQGVNWNTSELPVAHSAYIDTFSDLLDGFKRKLQNLQRTIAPQTIPQTLQKTIWETMISHIFDCLVEGYATGQCSTEGRAKMGFDFQNMQTVLSKIAPISPLPHTKFVDVYIKAFYMQGDDLETWLKDHQEYTSKQQLALVSSGQWDLNTKRQCIKFINK